MTKKEDRKRYLQGCIAQEQLRLYDASNLAARRTLAQMFLWDYLSTMNLSALEHWYTNLVATRASDVEEER